MIYDPTNPYDIEKAKKRFNQLIEGVKPFELKGKNPPRSNPQNAYIHVIIDYFAVRHGERSDVVKKTFFKVKCNREIFVRSIDVFGERIEYVRSSKDLDTLEMTTAIERFRNWSSAVAGIYLPSPNEEQFLIHVSQEIERNKAYI